VQRALRGLGDGSPPAGSRGRPSRGSEGLHIIFALKYNKYIHHAISTFVETFSRCVFCVKVETALYTGFIVYLIIIFYSFLWYDYYECDL